MCEIRIKRIIALLKTSFDKLLLTLPKMAYEKLIQAGVKCLEITTPQISMTLDLETLKAIYKKMQAVVRLQLMPMMPKS